MLALGRVLPHPPVLPGHPRLDEQQVPVVLAAQFLQHVQGQVQPLARGHHADQAQVEPGAVQLGPVQLGDVEGVRHRRHLGLRPAGVLTAQPRVVLAHAHHLVHGADLELTGIGRAQFEAVQPHQQPCAAPLVPAVPDRVRPAPLADHHVGPGGELPASRLVVLAECGH